MKQFLLIFALLIASCDEEKTIPCKSVAIQISDANPIQFWPVDCLTYNENEVCGIHPKCWCHPWECDDEIPTQFTDTTFGENRYLEAYDSLNNLVGNFLFSMEDQFLTLFDFSFSNSEFDVSLTNWGNYSGSPGSSASWNWAGGFALADGTAGTRSDTYELHQQRLNIGSAGFDKYPAGAYVFKILILNQSSGGSAPLQEGLVIRATNTLGVFGENSAAVTVVRSGVSIEYTVNFTTTQPWKYFTAQVYKQGPSGGSAVKVYFHYFRMSSYPYDYTNTVYKNSFVPSVEGICDQKVQLFITDPLSSPSTLLKSDCVDIADTQDCTKLIEYSNNRNFAGLIYTGLSPEQVFQIRVPAIFFHEQFPEEDEAMELTTGIQKTSGTLKVQRLFDTDYMPYYMHKKLQLIFKHQFITIDDLSWLKEEKYEIQQGERRWPIKKAKCFLTQDYIQRAVL